MALVLSLLRNITLFNTLFTLNRGAGGLKMVTLEASIKISYKANVQIFFGKMLALQYITFFAYSIKQYLTLVHRGLHSLRGQWYQ